MTSTNQSYRQGVARETRHALFVTNPSTMTVTNPSSKLIRFLKEPAKGLKGVDLGWEQMQASDPEEDRKENRKYREGGRSEKRQLFTK
jgi:hypothetical protein